MTALAMALRYAARGWPVFPCHTPTAHGCSCRRGDCARIGKHPRTQHGLSDATTDEATIRRWWSMWPDANVAIRTGAVSGLVVLDDDSYKGGDESLSDLERTYQPLPETAQQLTGGGGVQFLFMHPGTHVKNGVESLGTGLDIRGDGGYVIAPPSLHESGKHYAWEMTHDPDETALAPLPPWLLALCQETTRRDAPSAGEPIPQGRRNQTLFQHGCSFRARGCTEAVILAALREMNATQCHPPLPDDEVCTVAHSCAQYQAGQAPPGASPPPDGQARQEPQASPEPLSFLPALLSFQELLTLELPDRKRYVEWLPERGLVMVYGPRGAGKTMFMLGLATALTTGEAFLKWQVSHTTGVLYVDGEMPISELRDRTVALAGAAIPQGLHFLTGEMVYERLHVDLTLTGADARSAIEAVLDAHTDMKIVILDNISCLFSGISEDKKQDWEPTSAWLVRLRHRGITVVLVHHAGKGGQQRGTSGREDALDAVIALSYPENYNPEDGCHFHLRFEKSRAVRGDAVASLDVKLEDGDEWPHLDPASPRRLRQGTDRRDAQ